MPRPAQRLWHVSTALRYISRNNDAPEQAIQYAKHEPIAQHHMVVAGPPAMSGGPHVAGTDPKTPRIEIAYETVDHFEKALRSSCIDFRTGTRHSGAEYILAGSPSGRANAHHHPGS